MRTTVICGLALLLTSGLVLSPASAAPASESVQATSVVAAGSSVPSPATTATRRAGAAATAGDFSSIFTGADSALAGSGWTACPAPIAWSVDTAGLTAEESAEQIANLSWAFARWSEASGLAFTFAGTEPLTYDDQAFTLSPSDGSPAQLHHIYLDFVADGASERLSDVTVGLGSPTQVMASSKEIVAGDAVFRTDHVERAGIKEVRSLYLHELGHVLGLAHATATANVMFPVVRSRDALGAGDVNGVRAMTKPCTA